MILGFNDVYHMTSMLEENPRDSDMWVEAYEAKFEGKGKPFGKEDWDQLLGHCEVCQPQTTFLSYSRGVSLTEQHLGRDGLARSHLCRRAHSCIPRRESHPHRPRQPRSMVQIRLEYHLDRPIHNGGAYKLSPMVRAETARPTAVLACYAESI